MQKKIFTTMKKKLLTATLLALVLSVGIFPATAFAGTLTAVTEVTITSSAAIEPVAGQTQTAAIELVTETDPEGAADVEQLLWAKVTDPNYDGIGEPQSMVTMQEGEKFEAGNYYMLIINVDCDTNYNFQESDDGLLVTLNNDYLTYIQPAPADNTDFITLYKAYYVSTGHTHSYNPDKWTTNATYHWHQCTDANCPDKTASIKDKEKHTLKWVVDRKATTDKVGIQHKVCTECGYTCDENTKIAKLTSDSDSTKSNSTGSDSSPQTGDTMNIALPLGIMLVSGAGVGLAMYLRKKQHN